MTIYLDVILLLKQIAQEAEKDFNTTVKILEGCGFLVNKEKSVKLATQSIQYLGLEVDIRPLFLSLKREKVDSIVALCQRMFHNPMVFLREISSPLGSLSWTIQAVPFVQSHFRSLQAFIFVVAITTITISKRKLPWTLILKLICYGGSRIYNQLEGSHYKYLILIGLYSVCV